MNIALCAQVMEFIEGNSLADCIDFLKRVTNKDLADCPGSVPSLAVNQVLLGDVVYLPLGYMFLERAVSANSVCIKVP